MSERRYRIACLSGGGVGAEVMGGASSVLQEIARLHGFSLEEVHVSFGAEARVSRGHPLPSETREAYRKADAILVASGRIPALDGVRSELELAAELRRAGFAPKGDVIMINPLADEHKEWTIARALALAGERRSRLASVEVDRGWRELIEEMSSDLREIEIEHLSLETAELVLGVQPHHFDVIVTGHQPARAISSFAATRTIVAAEADLATSGPSLFGPTHATASEIAGQGVASPSGIFVAVSLLLSEGLGERAAAIGLDRAIRSVLSKGTPTVDLVKAGIAATTHEFTESVLSELVRARSDDNLSTEA